MGKEHYGLVIVTNVPSFYKINLYNLINKDRRLLVFFTNDTAGLRQKDFFDGKMEFDNQVLASQGSVAQILEFRRRMKGISFDELMICGLNEKIHWYCAFRYPKRKNSTVVESSYHESQVTGLKGFIKKIYFKRISKAYVSGKSQARLAELLGFRGRVIVTGGVGIFNINPQPPYESRQYVKRFLYVGRLAKVKNLAMLINVFKRFPQLTLSIVGYGPLEQELKLGAGDNVVFLGAVDNKNLPAIYRTHDVFILPSEKEPWGLVVEEALNNGLPLILSSRVGCAESLLQDGKNGFIFKYNDEDELAQSIIRICEVNTYNRMRKYISTLDFNDYAIQQASCYLKT